MGFHIKSKSEDYILHKLNEEISMLNGLVKNLYEKQCIKSQVNKEIIKGIKEEGHRYKEKLEYEKRKIFFIIEDQKKSLMGINQILKKMMQYLDLLIHLEQASLAIHTSERHDDLSNMIDVHSMPLDKFKHEIEHLKMLSDSFDILKVELEKQKEFMTNFTLDNAMDEHYFYESEKLEAKLSEEEVINVSQLKNFCEDLKHMVNDRLDSSMPIISDSDKVAKKMIDELKRIKVKNAFLFPFTFYKLVNKIVFDNVKSKHLQKLIAFLVFFLLSRMKKFKVSVYYKQLRATILCFNLLDFLNITKNQKFLITGAVLFSKFEKLNLMNYKAVSENDEVNIVKNYYITINQLFLEELPFISSLMVEYHKESDPDSLTLPWINDGASIIKLVFDFDSILCKYDYNSGKIDNHMNEIIEVLLKRHNGCENEINFLLTEWHKIIPRELTIMI